MNKLCIIVSYIPDTTTDVEQTGNITNLTQSTKLEEGNDVKDNEENNNMPELMDHIF